MSSLSASAMFGIPDASASVNVGGGAPSAMPGATSSKSGSLTKDPGVVLLVVVLGTAAALGHASKPLARGSVNGKLGSASAAAEGSI
ncbi:MAG: hypothetical protein JWM85_1125 [Acidimicrobiaceae bacterium]|nr:hypothetical protein [Acidimicrobiaceae bacterium]